MYGVSAVVTTETPYTCSTSGAYSDISEIGREIADAGDAGRGAGQDRGSLCTSGCTQRSTILKFPPLARITARTAGTVDRLCVLTGEGRRYVRALSTQAPNVTDNSKKSGSVARRERHGHSALADDAPQVVQPSVHRLRLWPRRPAGADQTPERVNGLWSGITGAGGTWVGRMTPSLGGRRPCCRWR
jgi:hypothetical protein